MILNRKLSIDEVVEEEKKLSEQLGLTPESRAKLRDFLSSELSSLTPETQYDYFFPYFCWYARLTWQDLEFFSDKEKVVDAFFKLSVAGLITKSDLWRSMLGFISKHNFILEPEILQDFYLKNQQAFFSSPAVLGKMAGKNILVSEFIKKIINGAETRSTMEEAALMRELSEIVFENERREYFKEFSDVKPEEFVKNFFHLVYLFNGIDKDHIWFVADVFIHSGYIGDDVNFSLEQNDTGAAVGKRQPVKSLEPQTVYDNYSFVKNKPTAAPVKAKEPIGKYAEIKKRVLATFPSAEPEKIIAFLEQESDRLSDSSIRELYYFDEKVGDFVWNEDLLKRF